MIDAPASTTDIYGALSPFKRGDFVMKTGSGYAGPGVVFTSFLGDDRHWRHVVGHTIDGGEGCFYHIYGTAQMRRIGG